MATGICPFYCFPFHIIFNIHFDLWSSLYLLGGILSGIWNLSLTHMGSQANPKCAKHVCCKKDKIKECAITLLQLLKLCSLLLDRNFPTNHKLENFITYHELSPQTWISLETKDKGLVQRDTATWMLALEPAEYLSWY